MEIRPGRYRHFKGKEYQVLGVAVHPETLEPMVVYRALYGEGGLWVRPASMWSGQVERAGGAGRLLRPPVPVDRPIAERNPGEGLGQAGRTGV